MVSFTKPPLSILIAVSFLSLPAGAEDDRPILHESPQKLVALIDSSVREVTAAAAVNVIQDVAQKRLRVFASSVRAKRGIVKVGDFEVETVFDFAFLPSEKAAPLPYHTMHNGLVLSFACSQITSGKKEFGMGLVKLLAQAQPTYRLGPGDGELSISEFLAQLEQESERAKQELKQYSENWEYRLKEHKQ